MHQSFLGSGCLWIADCTLVTMDTGENNFLVFGKNTLLMSKCLFSGLITDGEFATLALSVLLKHQFWFVV